MRYCPVRYTVPTRYRGLAKIIKVSVRKGMVEQMSYSVTFERGRDGWWTVYATDESVKGALSQGRTIERAEVNIKEAIALVLDLEEGAEADIELVPTFITGDQVFDERTAEALAIKSDLSRLHARRDYLIAMTATEGNVSTRDLGRIYGLSAGRISQVRKSTDTEALVAATGNLTDAEAAGLNKATDADTIPG